jgi:hypothetical protein
MQSISEDYLPRLSNDYDLTDLTIGKEEKQGEKLPLSLDDLRGNSVGKLSWTIELAAGWSNEDRKDLLGRKNEVINVALLAGRN